VGKSASAFVRAFLAILVLELEDMVVRLVRPPKLTGVHGYRWTVRLCISFDVRCPAWSPVLAREGLPLLSKLRSRRWTKLKSLPAGQSAPLRKSCIFTDPRSSLTNEVLFAGGDHGLWVTDGTAQGTHEVNAIKNAYPGSLSPSNFVVFDGKALFEGVDAQNHESLWVTNGTASGTHELVGIKNANPNGLDPQEMTVLNGEVLFRGVDANGQINLWITNGTAQGTHELTGIADAYAGYGGMNAHAIADVVALGHHDFLLY